MDGDSMLLAFTPSIFLIFLGLAWIVLPSCVHYQICKLAGISTPPPSKWYRLTIGLMFIIWGWDILPHNC
tara:strand:- start:65 stop:274 length:210 start_codon:yes stop_codon:yes gene_type:complete